MKWLLPEPTLRHEVATTWPERKYSEKLENVRLVFRSFVHWYVFFWTINITILQLQYYRSAGANFDVVDIGVAVLFVILNLMGVGLCYFARRTLSEDTAAAMILAHEIDATGDRPFDHRLFNYVLIVGAMSLVLNCAIWSLMVTSAALGRDGVTTLIHHLF